MLTLEPMVIKSVDPLEGYEGTIVTLQGSGFANHVRNNCIVIGGMGACARAEPNPTSTELKVRVGPVARRTEGDLLAWPGIGSDIHTEKLSHGGVTMLFSETAVFRNGAPVAAAGVNFKLTKVSPNTYGGSFDKVSASRVQLGGHEAGSVMRVSFPSNISIPRNPLVDICLVLKEPTLAVDFTAGISKRVTQIDEVLRLIAKTITVNASLIGERVFADVAQNRKTRELELYVTKPYLENGMFTVHFRSATSRGGRARSRSRE